MRFRITITKESKHGYLPINYQYELSSAIYRAIYLSNSDFSQYLHERGYLAFGKSFRLFTFSRLSFDMYSVIKESGRIEHRGREASFEISFLVDRAAKKFIMGLFVDQVFELGDRISKIHYTVSRIDTVTAPEFKKKMTYRCLSPIFLRKKRAGGREDYLHPNDEDYGILMVQNLLSKMQAFQYTENGNENCMSVFPQFDVKPICMMYKNGVKIKQLTAQETMLIGYLYEIVFTAPIELHEIGYYSGFGHLNSQGFGCVMTN